MAFLTVEDETGSIEVIVFPKTLEECRLHIREGNVALIRGRISMREDEDTKIVCENIGPCPDEKSVEITAEPEQKNEKKKVKGLFLRFDNASSPQIEVCRRFLAIFDGETPLYYFFADKKEYNRNPIGQNIDVNKVLLRELRKILGDSNVIYNE